MLVEEKASLEKDTLQYSESPVRDETPSVSDESEEGTPRSKLPLGWRIAIMILTCLCTFGNHWSNGLIVALKTTIIKQTHINNSEFATLVAITNLINTFLCVIFGLAIDRYGGAVSSVFLASFHLSGAMVMAGASTNGLNSYPLLIVGKVLAAIGDGSLDNAQHRIFSTYFAPGKGFALSIGAVWGMANLAQFTGTSTANIITRNLGSYSWAMWISAVISAFSLICAVTVFFLDRYLRREYFIKDQTSGKRHSGAIKGGAFNFRAIKRLPVTFWLVVLFSVFENAGVQSFVSISTQFAQQRLQKGAVVGGWVSSFYLLLPACLTPFLGIFIDFYGQRVLLLLLSGVTFLISMLLLKFSHTIPPFIAAYVFYAISQCLTPAPQVEIIRSIIPDPQYFATGFAVKKSVVQASIVIITTAAGKLQDDTANNSLEPAVSLWLSYAFASVAVAGTILFITYSAPTILPAARLAQISPKHLSAEVDRLCELKDIRTATVARNEEERAKDRVEKEKLLKAPQATMPLLRWMFLVGAFCIIVVGWIMFGLGVGWGVHGSVIAGTVGD